MKISQQYGEYVACEELNGRDVTLTISSIALKTFDDGTSKPAISFKNARKGFLLNKTNSITIATMYGDETDGWIGKPITLFPTDTDFGGKRVPCIRVRPGQAPQQDFQAPPKNPPDPTNVGINPNTFDQNQGGNPSDPF
ncbi:MAG: hypothetical protein V3U60_16525 [Gammaproteobacteria bacterium]